MPAVQMLEAYFRPPQGKQMDPRGMYAVQTEDEFIVFTGSKCRGKTRAEYAKFFHTYLQKLQSYEKAPQKVRFLEQSELGLEFFKLWGLDEMPESPFAELPAYNFYYQNVRV